MKKLILFWLAIAIICHSTTLLGDNLTCELGGLASHLPLTDPNRPVEMVATAKNLRSRTARWLIAEKAKLDTLNDQIEQAGKESDQRKALVMQRKKYLSTLVAMIGTLQQQVLLPQMKAIQSMPKTGPGNYKTPGAETEAVCLNNAITSLEQFANRLDSFYIQQSLGWLNAEHL